MLNHAGVLKLHHFADQAAYPPQPQPQPGLYAPQPSSQPSAYPLSASNQPAVYPPQPPQYNIAHQYNVGSSADQVPPTNPGYTGYVQPPPPTNPGFSGPPAPPPQPTAPPPYSMWSTEAFWLKPLYSVWTLVTCFIVAVVVDSQSREVSLAPWRSEMLRLSDFDFTLLRDVIMPLLPSGL